MRPRQLGAALALFLLIPLARMASAQANPTALQLFQLSAFGGFNGTYTDILGGRNLGITAGVDLDVYSFHGFHPSLELRGTYPIHSGTIDSQKDFLAGVRVDHSFGRLRPYADFLVGRGQIDYQHSGFQVGNLIYLASNTFVYSPGVGLDIDLTHHWAAKGDLQYQSWDTPVIPGGTIHPKVITAALVYRFDFNQGYHLGRRKHAGKTPQPVQQNPSPAPQSAPQNSPASQENPAAGSSPAPGSTPPQN